jgi:CheY-like chemotaxis protein
LLAEDNPINQIVSVKQLKKMGCEVNVASNGIEVLEAWREKRHRIILMDCQMPQMDGYKAAQKIRHSESAENLPHTFIIALTDCAMQGDRELCLATGVNDYISKPVNEMELRAALERGIAETKISFPESTLAFKKSEQILAKFQMRKT